VFTLQPYEKIKLSTTQVTTDDEVRYRDVDFF
jgi:phage gp16-like protein